VSVKAKNMIKVQENGQESNERQVRAEAVLAVFRSRFPKREVHGFE